MPGPEDEAREVIDAKLVEAGWVVQDVAAVNLGAAHGVAVREFPLKPGHGEADYLLYVDAEAIGVIEAKPSGFTLTSAEGQARRYSEGLPDDLNAHHRPLPFPASAARRPGRQTIRRAAGAVTTGRSWRNVTNSTST